MMKSDKTRSSPCVFLAVIFLSAGFTACGSSNDETCTDCQEVKLTLHSAADWVGLQIDDQGWQIWEPSAAEHYERMIAPDSKYLIIEHAVINKVQTSNLIMATAAEATEWLGFKRLTSHRVAGSLLGLEANQNADISINGSYLLGIPANAPAFDLANVLEGHQDIIVTVYGDLHAPDSFHIVRDVEVSADISDFQVDLAQDPIPMVHHSLTALGGDAFARFFTKNGTGMAGLGDTTMIDEWYAPGSGLQDGDWYSFIAKDDSSLDKLIFKSFPAVSDPGDLEFNLTAVTSLDSISFAPSLPLQITGLDYAPGAEMPPVQSYFFELAQETPAVEWTVLVSQDFLAGQSELTLPAVPTEPGWEDFWNLGADRPIWVTSSVQMSHDSMQTFANVADPGRVADTELHMAVQRGSVTPH